MSPAKTPLTPADAEAIVMLMDAELHTAKVKTPMSRELFGLALLIVPLFESVFAVQAMFGREALDFAAD